MALNMNEMVFKAEDIPLEKVLEGILLGSLPGARFKAKHANFHVVKLDPGAVVTEATHPDKEEFIYVISGDKGKVVLDGQEGEFKKGALIYIPVNVKHSTINTGKKTMDVLVIYAY